MTQRTYLELGTLEELATQYAMLAQDNYDSQTFAGDDIDNKRLKLRQQMAIRFGEYQTQEAIKQAFEILEMMDYHPKSTTIKWYAGLAVKSK